MKPEDFDLFAALLKQRSGFVLTRDKSYFLESRMLPIIRKYNMKSMDDLVHAIRTHRDEAMMSDVAEAMTSNDTSFFRDFKTFTHLRTILLPQLRALRRDKKRLRIWSAGTSSGQEAYSLAMLCIEAAADMEDWKIDIVATDLSKAMVARAKTGIYTQFEAQCGLPIQMLIKYFDNIGSDKWQIKESVRQMIQFREGNLLHDFGPIGVFDFVLCRNVLPSFEESTQKRVLDAIQAVMAPDGALLLGTNETVAGISGRFKACDERGLYTLGAPEVLAKAVVG